MSLSANIRLLFAVVIATVVAMPVFAQNCEDGICRFDRQINLVVKTSQSSGPSSDAAVRIHAGNGCGSGSVCGKNLILTNAHVVGTRVGRVVTVRPRATGQDIRGTVIMAAYSDRTLADWAVVRCDTGLESITPVRLSTKRPTGRHYTTGSPRCVWPLRSTAVVTANIADNSPLWRWRPNSIGGQSGSGVWSVDDNKQYGLLTWSWGGLGAGQTTYWIYKQATERSAQIGPDRIPGLIEVTEPAPFRNGDDVIVETGFFAQAGIDEFDIWDDGKDEPDTPDEPDEPDCPTCPEPDCPDCPDCPPASDLSEQETKVVEAMRKADQDDYEALVQIVLGILSLSSD